MSFAKQVFAPGLDMLQGFFGGGSQAAAAAPTAPDAAVAKQARDDAAITAQDDLMANSRRSTIAGGTRGVLESRQADSARKILG